MAFKALILAFGMVAAAAPVSATPDDMAPPVAPSAGPDARYCLRIELTGNIVEPVRCWTRAKWADEGVDVDKEWAENGVRVVEA